MDYDTDTLTSARNNRAASQKFYNQVMAPSRTLLPHEVPVMLHRSPSGAKRKIRQKREENGSRPSPFLSPSSSSVTSVTSTSPTPTEEGNSYRSLIDSGAYQSILPDLDSSYSPLPTRLNSSFSNSMSSLDLSTTTASPPPLPPSKPTVEVHPMPSEERTAVRGSVREKPAVPAKPKGLILDHMNRSTSLTSLASPVSQTTNTFLNNLYMTPSFANLQKEYKNADMGSQEFKRLETKRMESIDNTSHRISIYEDEQCYIEKEMSANESLGTRLLDSVERKDRFLANKIRRSLEHTRELLKMETKLRHQLEKVHILQRSAGVEQGQAILEENRLRRKLMEVSILRARNTQRERDHDAQLANVLSDEDMRRWTMYKENEIRFVLGARQAENHLLDSKIQLRELHNTRPIEA